MTTSAIAFQFSRCDDDPCSGFDLGHIIVIGQARSHSSIGRKPDQSMMIYISICALIGGLRKLGTSKKGGAFEFIGTDSSFAIQFKYQKKLISISNGGAIADVSYVDLLKSIQAGVNSFLAKPENQLSQTDPVFEDLEQNRSTLARLIREEHGL